jgi:hypothetical protein
VDTGGHHGDREIVTGGPKAQHTADNSHQEIVETPSLTCGDCPDSSPLALVREFHEHPKDLLTKEYQVGRSLEVHQHASGPEPDTVRLNH